MADNIFRSSRGRDPVARDDGDPDADASDPLAELARLIGRSEPRGGRHGGHAPAQPPDDPAAPALDWAADENYAPEHDRSGDRYAPPRDDSYAAYSDDRGYSQERGYAQDSGHTQHRRYAHEETGGDLAADDADHYDEHEPGAAAQRSASFAPTASDRHEADDQEYDDEGAYGSEADREASNPRRRGGLVVVVAVLGLAVLGTAGAFGYRAMFGGSVLPTLPPIIKPANGPNRIVPNYGDAQTNNSGEGTPDANSGEKLVSHEEQPVDMQEAPKAAPRVVSTIPITPNQTIAPPGMTAPGAPFNAAPAGAAPMPPPVVAAPPSGAAPQMAAPAPPTAPAPAGPRKVHTVTIRAEQPADADAAAAPAQPQPQRSAPHAAAPAPKSSKATSGGANQPMSLVPGASNEAAPAAPAPRTHSAAASPAASSEPAPAPASGGYAVQVSSQRSEADAQAAFKELQAKYPNQLGGREAIVRRADLGAKGTYYRALVGPFGSSEEAAAMCSSLKAAGGNCLVQRN
jgi:SPOR domain